MKEAFIKNGSRGNALTKVSSWTKLAFLFYAWICPLVYDLTCYHSIDFFQGLNACNWTRSISKLLLRSGPFLLLFSPSSALPKGYLKLDQRSLKAKGLIRQLHYLVDSGLCFSSPSRFRFQISSQSMLSIQPLLHWSGSITCPSI